MLGTGVKYLRLLVILKREMGLGQDQRSTLKKDGVGGR